MREMITPRGQSPPERAPTRKYEGVTGGWSTARAGSGDSDTGLWQWGGPRRPRANGRLATPGLLSNPQCPHVRGAQTTAMTLTALQLRALVLLYEHFDQTLAWPEVRRLQREVFGRGDPIELEEIVAGLEPRYVRSDHVRGGIVRLTLRAFQTLMRGTETTDFVCLLRMGIEAYRRLEGELEVLVADLRHRCGLDDRRLRKLNLLLQDEYLVITGSRTSAVGEIVAWRLQDQVRRFADVHDIDRYLELRDQLAPPVSAPYAGMPTPATTEYSFGELLSLGGRTAKDERASRSVFVAYPWSVASREDYKDAYRSLQQATGVSFIFAEDRISDEHVLEKILGMIRNTAFGIYDVTGWNPNVTLEYGYARGIGARAFIAFNPALTERNEVPADIRGFDRIQYGTLAELRMQVAQLLAEFFPSGQL